MLARLVQGQLRFENRYPVAKQDFLAASVIFIWPIYLTAAAIMQACLFIKKGLNDE